MSYKKKFLNRAGISSPISGANSNTGAWNTDPTSAQNSNGTWNNDNFGPLYIPKRSSKVTLDLKTNVLEIMVYDENNDGYPKSIWMENLDLDAFYTKVKYAYDELYEEMSR